jgi:hypothetical protein
LTTRRSSSTPSPGRGQSSLQAEEGRTDRGFFDFPDPPPIDGSAVRRGHPVVCAAELLDFVETPKRLVVLELEGLRFVRATPEDRKAIWREHLLRLRLFRDIHEVLKREPNHEIDKDFVLETIVMHMSQENYERTFATLIRWARFGNLFAYDEQTEMISLQESEAADQTAGSA